MIECIFMRRKLYEYMENSLSAEVSVKVKRHLARCAVCRGKLGAMARLIQVVGQKNVPQPSEEFWDSFRTDLHQKLNQRLSPSLERPLLDLKPKLSYLFRPAYVLPAFLVIVLAISFYLRYNNPAYFNPSDTAIINEVSLLEELSPDISIGNGGSANIDELNILYKLGMELNFS